MSETQGQIVNGWLVHDPDVIELMRGDPKMTRAEGHREIKRRRLEPKPDAETKCDCGHGIDGHTASGCLSSKAGVYCPCRKPRTVFQSSENCMGCAYGCESCHPEGHPAQPKPDADGVSHFKQLCGECGQSRGGHQVTEVGHKFVEPARPKPDAAGEAKDHPLDRYDLAPETARLNARMVKVPDGDYVSHYDLIDWLTSAPRNPNLPVASDDVQFLNDFMRMQGHEIREAWERVAAALALYRSRSDG